MSALVVALLAGAALAQQAGNYTPEVHPPLSSQRCTRTGCTTLNTSVVLDSNYRWLHSVGGYDACYSGGFNSTLCPNATACAHNCAYEGVDYASNGVSTNGSSLTLNLFVTSGNTTNTPSPRVYLLASEHEYELFRLLNKEFAYTVDVSKVPCGVNGALYFSEMSATGNQSPTYNPAGAQYGTGYCDAQCPKNNFIAGKANFNNSLGACCNEMDIWEANDAANALTPHPCNATGTKACSGTACSNDLTAGTCDQDGCDFNPFRVGNQHFYGPNMTINTLKPFTVVTQFLTNGHGTLSEIRRIYKQGTKVVHNTPVNVTGVAPYSSITENYCKAEAKAFNSGNSYTFDARGGMAQMGKALGRGMVLAMSIWEDSGSYMQWLDGQTGDISQPGNWRGPCSTTSGQLAEIIKDYPNAAVTFSNIKIGDLNTTY